MRQGPVALATAVLISIALSTGVSILADSGEVTRDGDPVRRGFDEKFFLGVGVFAVNFDTTARKSSSILEPTPTIDLEDLLGLDEDRFEFSAQGYWRLASRHRLTFGYVYLNRDATSVTLDEEIEFDDTTFPVGAEVRSLFDTQVVELGYDYSFLKASRYELGLSTGIKALEFRYGLEGEGTITDPDGSVVGGFFSEQDKLWVPVPEIGMHYGYSIAPNWFLRTSAKVFGLSLSGWKARLIDVGARVEAYPWKVVGFGFGYNLLEILYIDKGDDELRLDYGFSGWSFYLSVVF